MDTDLAYRTNKALQEFAQHVKEGLSAQPKWLSSSYFYDEAGSALFNEITCCPEYYLTRAEKQNLEQYAPQMARNISEGKKSLRIIELGGGSGEKTMVLLQAFSSCTEQLEYLPVDISDASIKSISHKVHNEFPSITISEFTGNYWDVLRQKKIPPAENTLWLYLGSNIGNMSAESSSAFFSLIAENSFPGNFLLSGFDLVKDPALILAAYNDAAGITARFNLNLLHRINRELGADFNVNQFFHYPVYDPRKKEARSYIVSRCAQTVHVKAVPATFHFGAWETIYTEVSRKYTLNDIDHFAETAGYQVGQHFTGDEKTFCDSLWVKKS